MALNEAQRRVVDEEMRRFAETIRDLLAMKEAMNPRWTANNMDALADDLDIERPGVAPLTGAQLKQAKAAFDALETAALADPAASELISRLCVRPLSVGLGA